MHSVCVSAFLDAIRPDSSLWRSLDVRLIAVLASGQWRNLFTLATLRSETPADVPKLIHPVEAPVLRGEQHVLPIEELPGFLDAVEGGAWPRQNPVSYVSGQFDLVSAMGYEFRHQQFHEVGRLYAQPELEWGAEVLAAGGDSTGTIIARVPGAFDQLQGVVRQHSYPFETLDYLVRYVLEISQPVSGANAFCRVVAPYEVRIEPGSVHLADGIASVSVVATSRAAAEAARLQLTTQPASSEIPATSLLPPVDTWITLGPKSWRWTERFTVGDVNEVAFVLHCGTKSLQWVRRESFRVQGRSVQLVLNETLDPGLEQLRRSLSFKGKSSARQSEFEEAVARLFTLAGFQVQHFVAKQMSDGVDFIAYAADDLLVLAVECTTHAITAAGKLSKLVARAAELREAIAPSDLQPVIATCLPGDGIADPDWESARRSQVLVLTRETLLDILNSVQRGSAVRELLELIRRRGTRQLVSAY